MTALPPSSDATGSTVTEGQFKTWLTNVRDYLSGMFGTDGTIATALSTLGVLFGASTPAVSVTTNITAADRGKVYRASGTITLNLPTVASAGAGWSIAVQNGGTGVVTLDGASAETVDGAATAAIPRGRTAIVMCNGTGWETFAMPGKAAGPVLIDGGSATAPGLAVAGDENTGIGSANPDELSLGTGGVWRAILSTTFLRSTVPFYAPGGSLSAPAYAFNAETGMGFYRSGSNNLSVGINGTEVMRWIGSGWVGMGTVPAARFHIASDAPGTAGATSIGQRAVDDTIGARYTFRKSRGAVAAPTPPLAEDNIGVVRFEAWDGAVWGVGATITAVCSENAASGSTPARLIFGTAASGASAGTTRLRLDSDGAKVTGRLEINSFAIGGTSVVVADDAVTTLTPGRTGGFLFLTTGGGVGAAVTNEAACAFLRFDCGATAASIEKGTGFTTIGALVDVSTSALTGTTGVDGRLTVSARNDGTIQIENRLGTSSTVNVGWL